MKILILFSLFLMSCSTLNSHASNSETPNECIGSWKIDPVEDDQYFSRPFKRFPKSLEITSKKSKYTDNHGSVCNVLHFDNEENKTLTFINCLPPSHPDLIPTHYVIECAKDSLSGNVRTYKNIYNFKGQRID